MKVPDGFEVLIRHRYDMDYLVVWESIYSPAVIEIPLNTKRERRHLYGDLLRHGIDKIAQKAFDAWLCEYQSQGNAPQREYPWEEADPLSPKRLEALQAIGLQRFYPPLVSAAMNSTVSALVASHTEQAEKIVQLMVERHQDRTAVARFLQNLSVLLKRAGIDWTPEE